MSINPLVAGSVVIAALASAHGVSAQNQPPAPTAPAATTNVPAPAIAEQADRLLKEMASPAPHPPASRVPPSPRNSPQAGRGLG
jgi:hypothetical protein